MCWLGDPIHRLFDLSLNTARGLDVLSTCHFGLAFSWESSHYLHSISAFLTCRTALCRLKRRHPSKMPRDKDPPAPVRTVLDSRCVDMFGPRSLVDTAFIGQ